MANAKTNPLNARVSSTTVNNFRVPPLKLPHLGDHLRQQGFSAGHDEWQKKAQEAVDRWAQDLERQLGERFQPKAASPTATP